MIKKLRLKFILISMLSLVIVLILIIGSINISNYQAITKKADETIKIIINNNGRYPYKFPDKHSNNEFTSPEAFYETRYFSVVINKQKEIIRIDLENVSVIDENNAYEYTLKILKKNKDKGFIDNYRYFKIDIDKYSTMCIFLDCNRSLNIYYQFLQSSIMMSIIVIILVLALVILFSSIITAPLAKTYQKQKQFITNASHDLKTPLTIINGSCEILEYNDLNNEWIQTIKEQVAKLTSLTNKLVFLTKMDESANECQFEDFSLSETIEELIIPYQQLLDSQNKHFNYDIQPNIIYHGNEKMISEMITLLLDNALKYSNDLGNVDLQVQKSGRNIKIVLSNTADNIPVGNLDKLFERFTRLDSSRNSDTGGHGIGLSVVKTIVETHKGKIKATSDDGRTIAFTILL